MGPIGEEDASVVEQDATTDDAYVPAPVDSGELTDSKVVADVGTAPVDTGVKDATTDTGAPDAETDAGTDAGTSCMLANAAEANDMCDGDIIINEIDGSGDDFIEIYNRGTTNKDISGYLITDDSGGSPAVAEGVTIPAGTVLEPKRFYYVWANQPPEVEGTPPPPYNTCIPGKPTPCLHSTWGVSNGGERIYLLNASLEVICAYKYLSVIGSEAFGRVPDGSSMLCPTNPTPGESNVRSTQR